MTSSAAQWLDSPTYLNADVSPGEFRNRDDAKKLITDAREKNNGQIFLYDNLGPYSTSEDRFTLGVDKSTSPYFTAKALNPNNNNVVKFTFTDCDEQTGYCELNGEGVGCLTLNNDELKYQPCLVGDDAQYWRVALGKIVSRKDKTKFIVKDTTSGSKEGSLKVSTNWTSNVPLSDWSTSFSIYNTDLNKSEGNSNKVASDFAKSVPADGLFFYSDEPLYTRDNDKYVISDKNSVGQNIGVAGPNVASIVKKIKFINCNDNEGWCQLQFNGNRNCINLGDNNIVNEGICTNADEQKWRFINGNLVSKKTRQCMIKSVQSDNNRGDLVMLDCPTTSNWKTTDSKYDRNVNLSEGNMIINATTSIIEKYLYDPNSSTMFGNREIIYFNDTQNNFNVGDATKITPTKFSQDQCDERAFCKLFTVSGGATRCIGTSGEGGMNTVVNQCENISKNKWRYEADKKFHWMEDRMQCLSFDGDNKLILTNCQ